MTPLSQSSWTRVPIASSKENPASGGKPRTRRNAAEALGKIRPKEGTQSFTSPMILFEDADGRPAELEICVPDSLNIDDLEIEPLA